MKKNLEKCCLNGHTQEHWARKTSRPLRKRGENGVLWGVLFVFCSFVCLLPLSLVFLRQSLTLPMSPKSSSSLPASVSQVPEFAGLHCRVRLTRPFHSALKSLTFIFVTER